MGLRRDISWSLLSGDSAWLYSQGTLVPEGLHPSGPGGFHLSVSGGFHPNIPADLYANVPGGLPPSVLEISTSVFLEASIYLISPQSQPSHAERDWLATEST